MILALTIVSILVVIVGVVWIIINLSTASTKYEAWKSEKRFRAANEETPPSPPKAAWKIPVILIVAGIFFVIWLTTSTTYVPVTHIAVIENTFTGGLDTLGPGTHIWPFQPKRVPFVTKVTNYSLRRLVAEVGVPAEKNEHARENGIEGVSISPGRPVVFFYVRGWVVPNKDEITKLHRRHGPDYIDLWVEKNMVAAIKDAQGKRAYDFVGEYRVEFADIVETTLQNQLADDETEKPLAFISQLAVVNFGYTEDIEGYLDTVAEKEFARQQQEQQILINTRQKEAKEIEVEKDYMITKRNAEAEQAKRIAEADGEAEAIKLRADADAHRIKVRYEAEAKGITQVRQALNADYLTYQRQESWDGSVPGTLVMGETTGVVPFLDLMPEGESGRP